MTAPTTSRTFTVGDRIRLTQPVWRFNFQYPAGRMGTVAVVSKLAGAVAVRMDSTGALHTFQDLSILEPVPAPAPLWECQQYRIEGTTPAGTYYLGMVGNWPTIAPDGPALPWSADIFSADFHRERTWHRNSREAKQAIAEYLRGLA